MSQDWVRIETYDHILKITFNRPEKKNALAPDMYEAVSEALTQADADDNIRLVYLTGTQDSFTAGNDLTTFIDNPNSDAALRFIKAISVTETPIVAAVNGLAVGVGVTMLLHCDLVYAVESAKFNFAFIDLGIVPEAASSLLVPAMVGHRRAAELLMLGEKFDANTAQEIGLVNKVLSADELEDVAWGNAEKLATKPPTALRQTKMLLKRGQAEAVAETIDYELGIFAERIASEETRAIMQAILERRK
jgi:enoyl-CoA hydratase/carnithine racemase